MPRDEDFEQPNFADYNIDTLDYNKGLGKPPAPKIPNAKIPKELHELMKKNIQEEADEIASSKEKEATQKEQVLKINSTLKERDSACLIIAAGFLFLTGVPFSGFIASYILWNRFKGMGLFVKESGRQFINFQFSIAILNVVFLLAGVLFVIYAPDMNAGFLSKTRLFRAVMVTGYYIPFNIYNIFPNIINLVTSLLALKAVFQGHMYPYPSMQEFITKEELTAMDEEEKQENVAILESKEYDFSDVAMSAVKNSQQPSQNKQKQKPKEQILGEYVFE